MKAKLILVIGGLLLVLAGLFASGGRLWRAAAPASEPGRSYPPAFNEYQKIMERFNVTDSNVSMSGDIRIYDGDNKNALREQRTFAFIRYGNQFYSQISRLQTFCDGSVVLQLDTLNKTMVISTAMPWKNREINPISKSFDHLLSDTAKFRTYATVSRDGNDGVLNVTSDLNPEIKACTFYYDTISYRLRRTEIAWWKQQALTGPNGKDGVWLSKLDYRFENPHPLEMKKKIDAMISVKDEKPRPLYKNYKVISHLHRGR